MFLLILPCKIFPIICIIQSLEDKKKMEFITDYPIMIDGGCNFFTFTDVPLSDNKFILIISSQKRCFIKRKGNFLLYKKNKRIIYQPNMYTDIFSNGKEKLALKIINIINNNDGSSVQTGTLEVIDKDEHLIFKVHGIVNELDRNN